MIYFDVMFMSIYWEYSPLHMSYVGYIDILGISPNAHVLLSCYMIIYVGHRPRWTRTIVFVLGIFLDVVDLLLCDWEQALIYTEMIICDVFCRRLNA